MPDLEAQLRAPLADRYRVDREIGRGGVATVSLADDLRHHRGVAVQVLRPNLATTLGPDRFLREIETAAQLTHAHVLPLPDSGEAEGFLQCMMRYIEGESLREKLAKEGESPVADAVRTRV
jgi:serine/threonine-protein kinase